MATAHGQQVEFDLDLPASVFLHYYRGSASTVIVRALDGRRLQFPASALRPYVSGDGVRGRFVLTFGENRRLRSLRRLA